MWANSKFEDLVQYDDGFKTGMVDTREQIADRILLLNSLGVGILLVASLHYELYIKQFPEQILPLVRKSEAEGRGEMRIRDQSDGRRVRSQTERTRKVLMLCQYDQHH